MEGSPKEDRVNIDELVREIKKCDPEMEMHDLHVWSITQAKVVMSCHIKTKQNTQLILKEVSQVCKDKFRIGHVTIQMEDANSEEHQFECNQTTHKILNLDEGVWNKDVADESQICNIKNWKFFENVNMKMSRSQVNHYKPLNKLYSSEILFI